MILVKAPLDAANLLFVALELVRVGPGRSQVGDEDVGVAGAAANEGAVPGDAADSVAVVLVLAEELLLLDVENPVEASVVADGQVVALLVPGQAGHQVRLRELRHFEGLVRLRASCVDRVLQPDADDVVARPVQQVEVEIVPQARRVQNLERLLRNFANQHVFGLVIYVLVVFHRRGLKQAAVVVFEVRFLVFEN
jgi:hypothetical protein